MSDSHRDYSLSLNDTNVLKGLAICMMLWHHLFSDASNLGVAIYKSALFGKACVAIFVFISGYGLATQFAKKCPTETAFYIKESIAFLLKRFTKFYLSYWVIFLIAVPIGIFFFNRPLEAAYGANASIPKSFLLDFLGVMSYKSYNATWWFNRLIIVLYLLFPLLYSLMRSKILGPFIIAFLYFRPWQWQIEYMLEQVESSLQFYLAIFCLGIFIARHIQEINHLLNKFKPTLLCIMFSSLAILFCVIRNVNLIPSFEGYDVDIFIVLFLWLTTTSLKQLINREPKVLTYLGKHATNTYLSHTFFFSYFFSSFILGFKTPILIFIALLTCSLLFSITIEFIKGKVGFYKLQKKVLCLIENLSK